jgi:hypothetical protein
MAILEEGAQDASRLGRKDAMNAAHPFGPGSAEKFMQYRFRLVIQSVCGDDGVRLAAGHQLLEEGIAKVAGGLLQSLMERRSRGRSVGAVQVEWEVMVCGQPGYERSVLVGSGSTNAVMHVGHGKYDAQLAAFFEHAAQQGHGVSPSGNGDGNPLAGAKETGPESWRRHVHQAKALFVVFSQGKPYLTISMRPQ